MTDSNAAVASVEVRLEIYWANLPPGVGVTMQEMKEALDVADSQRIRNTLTRMRKGQIPNPAERGTYFAARPVRWNSSDRMYYDLSQVTDDSVMQQIPGEILSQAMGDLITRTGTIHSAVGEDGLYRAARTLLSDQATRALIQQLPLPEIWRAQDQLRLIGRARLLLEAGDHPSSE